MSNYDAFPQLDDTEHRLGQGGEHLVFDYPFYTLQDDGVAYVRKVNLPLIDTFRKVPIVEAYEQATAYAETINTRYAQLESDFGEEHVLDQFSRPYLLTLTDTEKELIWPQGPPPGHRFCTVLTFQQRFPALETEEGRASVLSLDTPYAERQDEQVDLATYTKIQQRFLTDQMWQKTFFTTELERFLTMQNNPSFRAIVLATGRLSLNVALTDFTQKAIQRARSTGEIMDICGKDNVLVGQNGGYLLVDAMMTTDRKQYWNLLEVFKKVQQDELLTFRERIELLNGMTYARTLNFLACYLGLDDRLEVVPGQKVPDTRWHKVYEYLARLPRAHQIHQPTEAYLVDNQQNTAIA